MHRQHGRTFSTWTGHSLGSPIIDDSSESHITTSKAKQRARQYANHREMREKSLFAASRVELKYQPPTASDFPLPQTAGGAQLMTGEPVNSTVAGAQLPSSPRPCCLNRRRHARRQWLMSDVRGGLNAAHHGGLQLARGSAVAQRSTARLYVPVSLYTSIDGHPITIEPAGP